nr:hypothetical protein Q903MT_gene295 [Picea sitchensis]
MLSADIEQSLAFPSLRSGITLDRHEPISSQVVLLCCDGSVAAAPPESRPSFPVRDLCCDKPFVPPS